MDPKIRELAEDYRLTAVLRHMSVAKVDYAKNVRKYTEIPLIAVNTYLEILLKYRYLTHYTNTSIKRSSAKLKKSAEVHKHHTYYEITREGEIALKSLTPLVYLKLLDSTNLENLLYFRKLGSSRDPKLSKMGLLDKENNITNLGRDILEEACRKKLIDCR
ncbi:MAG: DUF2250 domain-containing protein [Thermoplasmatales archaeon]|nr:DUF2250 domain-containing protein [Thermoplasmatales archaeon]MCW6169743.1 DUF2250 domain-containing protein [Thermoplasmatales archaeon]